jgi:hypothetical protein
MSSVQRRRVLGHITEVANQRIRTAIFDFDCASENEVERYRAMLVTSPGAAVLGLKRSALGVRLLISRLERLQRLLHEEGTLYGQARNELINYQGARAVPTESLSESAGAYLTWLYCLMAQPAPKDKDFVAMGNPRWMPAELDDRDPLDWLGSKDVCRQILKNTIERALTSLIERERHLRKNYEEPARDGAELRKQVLATPEGSLLLRHERAHDLTFHRAYGALLKGRPQSLKTGRPPGAPHSADDDEADRQDSAAVAADATRVAETRAERKREADAVAPGPGNGIGAPDACEDSMIQKVRAARPDKCPEAGVTPAEAPVEAAGSFAV